MSGTDALQYTTHSAQETLRFAAALAGVLRPGDWLTLQGDLGSGKTTFARGLIHALAPSEAEIVSPTFTLVQPYAVMFANGVRGELRHCDFYRLKHASEVAELGLETQEGVAVLIEWPEIAASHLPPERLAIYIKQQGSGDARRIRFEPKGSDWHARLRQFTPPEHE